MLTESEQIALAKVVEAQRIIDEKIALIGDTMDSLLGDSLASMSSEELENWIHAMPENCFYTLYFKRLWRKKQTV